MAQKPLRIRMIVLALAALQLAAPAMSAIADGLLPRSSVSATSTHVEDGTRASCPEVHSPDCALCRVLSLAAAPPRDRATTEWTKVDTGRLHQAQVDATPRLLLARSFSRAPPTV